MSQDDALSAMNDVVAAVWISGPPSAWEPTLVSLRMGAPGIRIVAGSEDPSNVVGLETLFDESISLPTVGNSLAAVHDKLKSHVLLVHAPAIFPPGFLDHALPLANQDLRSSSVSFISNVGGPASFPIPGVATSHQVDSFDEAAITRKLRESDGLTPAPLPYPVGPAVLVTSQGFSVAGGLPIHMGRPVEALAQFGAVSRGHGMIDFLEPSTFVSHATDEPLLYPLEAGLNPDELAALGRTHPGLALAASRPSESTSGYLEALASAHVAVFGVRVLLDGSCLGPKEMGTQVAFLGLAQALASRVDVSYIGIALATSPPTYAATLLSHPKVDARLAPGGDVSGFPGVDVFHRPFQVTDETNLDSWRKAARRTVVTIHDVVAFGIPDYHRTPEHWFNYRSATRDAASRVDGIIAISDDTRIRVASERLAIDDDRCFVVPDGVSHLRGDEREVIPEELMARGFSSEPFALVLGTNYSHKNRDLCIKVIRELRRRDRRLALVMAGALVPFGSSRSREARNFIENEPVYIVPDVRDEERNWLLRHAEVVLYPSAAEGFGLIPHEAAAFGTPTVVVPFGPISERLEAIPVAPKDWSVDEWVAATEALLSDPEVARRQVATFRDSKALWSREDAAASTVSAYRLLLARPARSTL